MADALVLAPCEDLPRTLVVDVATLTGAAIVALGERVAAVMASDDETADDVLDAAEASGEAFWHRPDPRRDARGSHQRRRRPGERRQEPLGGALTAAAFLRQFVGEGVRWAHLDIAGPAWNNGGPTTTCRRAARVPRCAPWWRWRAPSGRARAEAPPPRPAPDRPGCGGVQILRTARLEG